MLEQAKELQDELTRIRRIIHMNPELGFEELKTGALVTKTLSDLGIEYQAGVGKTGVVARLGNGNGPKIGIRADMDALPILEANDSEYKSTVPGVMHACGHDAHTTMLLGAAMLLKDQDFDGEILLAILCLKNNVILTFLQMYNIQIAFIFYHIVRYGIS